MATTHVISALVKKRAELSGELDALRKQMHQLKGEISTIENAILLFEPSYDVKGIKPKRKRTPNRFFEQGERTRAIIDTLRESEVAMSVREIAEELCEQREFEFQDADFDKMLATLNDGIRVPLSKGLIEVVSRANGTPRYSLNLDSEQT